MDSVSGEQTDECRLIEDLGFLQSGFRFKVLRAPSESGPGEVAVRRYVGHDTYVSVPEEVRGCRVVSVGKAAFAQCREMVSLDLPEGIVSIGDWAFTCCTALTSVRLPSTLRSIGLKAFNYCCGLKTIDLPEGLVFIDDEIFRECHALVRVGIPSTLMDMGRRPFRRCGSLSSIVVSEGNPRYSSHSGMLCDRGKRRLLLCPEGMEGVAVLPETVVEVAEYAFRECGKLVGVRLPAGLRIIEKAGFYACKSLRDLRLPDGLEMIGDNAFLACSSIEHVIIPGSVRRVGYGAFSDRYEDVILMPGVGDISSDSFFSLDLKRVSIPEDIGEFPLDMFYQRLCDGSGRILRDKSEIRGHTFRVEGAKLIRES